MTVTWFVKKTAKMATAMYLEHYLDSKLTAQHQNIVRLPFS